MWALKVPGWDVRICRKGVREPEGQEQATRGAFWLGVLLVLVAGCSSDTPAEMAPLSKQELAELPAVSYAELDALVKAQKGKVGVLAVWSVRREPCLAMYAKLGALGKGGADAAPAVIALNIDRVDDVRSKVMPMVKQQGAALLNRVFRGAPEELTGLFGNAWGGRVPAICLFDREGTKAAAFNGDDALAKAEPRLKELLEQQK
jgi:hypothetical protein